jgi:hypothetical protein
MTDGRARVLLIIPDDILGRARVFVGKATATLRLPVSLQIVLRALIEEGLKQSDKGELLANIEQQVHAVRHARRAARRGAKAAAGARVMHPARPAPGRKKP